MGYYRERSHRLVDVDHCPIAHPLVNQVLQSLRQVRSIFNSVEELEINVSPEDGRGILILRRNKTGPRPTLSCETSLKITPCSRGVPSLGRKDPGFWANPL